MLLPKGSAVTKRRKEEKLQSFRDTTLPLVILRQLMEYRCPSSCERVI